MCSLRLIGLYSVTVTNTQAVQLYFLGIFLLLYVRFWIPDTVSPALSSPGTPVPDGANLADQPVVPQVYARTPWQGRSQQLCEEMALGYNCSFTRAPVLWVLCTGWGKWWASANTNMCVTPIDMRAPRGLTVLSCQYKKDNVFWKYCYKLMQVRLVLNSGSMRVEMLKDVHLKLETLISI